MNPADPERRDTLASFLRQNSKPWSAEAAAELDLLTGIERSVPPRLWRILVALATVELPDGWTALYNDGPVGIVLRRNADGWKGLIVPSTDGTDRWYNDYSLDATIGGSGAGMSPTAQAAVDYNVEHAPDYRGEFDATPA